MHSAKTASIVKTNLLFPRIEDSSEWEDWYLGATAHPDKHCAVVSDQPKSNRDHRFQQSYRNTTWISSNFEEELQFKKEDKAATNCVRNHRK